MLTVEPLVVDIVSTVETVVFVSGVDGAMVVSVEVVLVIGVLLVVTVVVVDPEVSAVVVVVFVVLQPHRATDNAAAAISGTLRVAFIRSSRVIPPEIRGGRSCAFQKSNPDAR